jgi:hypothetical protein
MQGDSVNWERKRSSQSYSDAKTEEQKGEKGEKKKTRESQSP